MSNLRKRPDVGGERRKEKMEVNVYDSGENKCEGGVG